MHPGVPRRSRRAPDCASIALAVDGDGADPSSLLGRDAASARPLLTPAHQYPIGSTLAPSRRTAVHRVGARRAAPTSSRTTTTVSSATTANRSAALQAMDPERAVYVGTASKSLAPALRLGVDGRAARRCSTPSSPPRTAPIARPAVLDQAALAELIRSGALDRHVRRSRLALPPPPRRAGGGAGDGAPTSGPAGSPPGSTPSLELTGGPAGGRGGRPRWPRRASPCTGSAPYWHRRRPARQGLVVGFGTPPEHAFPAALAALIAGLR